MREKKLYIVYNTIMKKVICMSYDLKLIGAYLYNNNVTNYDVFDETSDIHIDTYLSHFENYMLEEHGDLVMTSRESIILMDMVNEEMHRLNRLAKDIQEARYNFSFSMKETEKLLKAEKVLEKAVKPENLKRVIDLNRLFKKNDIKRIVDMELELRNSGKYNDDGSLDDGHLFIIL